MRKDRFDSYHDIATAAIARRQHERGRFGRIAKRGLVALALGASLVAGTVGRDTVPASSCTPAVATTARVEPYTFISTPVYEGKDLSRAEDFARRLTVLGYQVDRQMGMRDTARQERLLVRTPDYATERRLFKMVSENHSFLPRNDVAGLLPGERHADGSYQFFQFDDHVTRLVDRYVSDTPHVKKEKARETILQYIRPLIQQESGFKYWARSNQGALGIMQVTPPTAQTIDNERAFSPEFAAFRKREGVYASAKLTTAGYGRLHSVPLANLDDGIATLWRNYASCDGDMDCTLASYNAGPGNADRWESIPETRTYVNNIQAMAKRVR